jgi:tRNA A-37 threonylcarbamoyl transferase component Bud32
MTESDVRETVSEKPSSGHERLPASSPVPPQLGPYALLEKLGEGGMGTVYKALHVRLKRQVALKVLPRERMNDPAAVARFHQEMEAVGKLDHPHIIRATDAGEAEGWHFLVMDFAAGVDLSHLVRRCGPLPIAEACELVRQAALGLQYIHEHGLVHRDVKPSNLLLTDAGQVKVLDLGLARLLRKEARDDRVTASGEVMGTADYMAPEQAVDSQKVDIRADVYSLGCTLYKLLAGQPPFGDPEHSSRFKKMMAHAQEPVPPIRDRRPDVPVELAAVLDHLLAKAPANRPPTPGAVVLALEPFTIGCDLRHLLARAQRADSGLSGEHGSAASAVASPETTPYKVPAAGRKWTILLASLVAVLALMGVGIVVHTGLPGHPTVEPGPGAAEEPAPGVWHNLLVRRPTEVFWRNQAGDSRLDYSAERQELHVDALKVGLLGLSQVSRPGYRLQVGIRQTRWVGGAGIFIGYQPHQDGDVACFKCQVLDLRPFAKNRPHPFAWHRSQLLIKTASDGTPVFDTRPLATVPVARPPDRLEQILEIEVNKRGLVRVRWDGQELPELTSARANARCVPADHVGTLGVYTFRSPAVYQNARLMYFDKEKP